MKLLLNDKEIAHFLNNSIDLVEKFKNTHIQTRHMTTFHMEWREKFEEWARYQPKKLRNFREDALLKKKFKEKLQKAIWKDLREWNDNIQKRIKDERERTFNGIHKNIDAAIEKLGEEKIFEAYKNSPLRDFIKGTGFNLDPNGEFIRRKNFKNYAEDCLIRNTVGNEDLLVTKIDDKHPFWFIDSGYTNFLEPNKKWHRLVRNHLHYGDFFDAPTTRLENFKKFPLPWRKGGDIIYVMEPGPFAASIFHCDLKTWRYEVEKELRQYTDKPIKFREKAPLRERKPLFKELLNDDFYCVISINSNAATEAIWAGIPAITLDKHITNPVTRNKVKDINNLFYGNLAQWLCMLSYQQFTKEELMNGTAIKLLRKYANV